MTTKVQGQTVGGGIVLKELKKYLKFSLGRSKSGASTTHPEIPSRKPDQNVEIVRVEMAVEGSHAVQDSDDRECSVKRVQVPSVHR